MDTESFGGALRRLRLSAGMSIRDLARLANCGKSYISDLEHVRSSPSLAVATALDKALGVGGELVALALSPPMWRAALSTSDDQERLVLAAHRSSRLDLVAVAHLRHQVHQLDDRYVCEPSTALLANAGQYLAQIRFLSTHAPNGRVRRELSAVEAEVATLMGQLVWDASQRRDHATAHLYLDQALRAARQCCDPVAEGLALLRKTIVVLYGEQNPRTALNLAQQTAETTMHASEVLRGLALLHLAEAHAMLGARAACEAALTEADTCFGRVDDTDAAIDLFSSSQFGRMAGSCYLFLKDHRRAQSLLEGTALTLNDRSKAQAIVLGNLALTAIRQGNLDDAAARLHQAIDVIEVNWGGGGLNIVFGASREMRSWPDVPVVQDVQDRLLSLMTMG
ncbi:helix-turn-helix transcriptional regulator [Nonomuraea sp. NPDC050404]|uniref:helix-turn-helix domain-containing protein n=1 Tax=Nonomuraea sp. NPDC050404 TaxID=3155783 RepID=UPI0033CA4F2D